MDTTQASTTMKTLPMKYKSMHYAILAYIKSCNEIPIEQKVVLLENLPIHNSPEEQVEFYTKLVDFKEVENEIIKPMKNAKKAEEKAKNKPVKKSSTKKKNTEKKLSLEIPCEEPTEINDIECDKPLEEEMKEEMKEENYIEKIYEIFETIGIKVEF